MTGQFPDDLRHRGECWSLTAVDGDGLFTPAAHGLPVQMLSTACWRGYRCTYEIRDDRLLLTAVQLGRPAGAGPPGDLFGVPPGRAPRRGIHAGALQYDGLAAPIAFTGRLLVGAGPVGIGRLAMGFRPAWRYARVRELVFAAGRLTADHDRSDELARVRERLGAAGLRPAPGEDGGDWVERAFSLSFAYSWPGGPGRP